MCTHYTLRYTRCNHLATSIRCPLSSGSVPTPSGQQPSSPTAVQPPGNTLGLASGSATAPIAPRSHLPGVAAPSAPFQSNEGPAVQEQQRPCTDVTYLDYKITDYCMPCRLGMGLKPGRQTGLDAWAGSREEEDAKKEWMGFGPDGEGQDADADGEDVDE